MDEYDKLSNDQWQFHIMLDKAMKAKDVSASRLCEGLCTASMLSRIRRGERISNHMMRERLLGRLGISTVRFENFLFYEDYIHWRERNEIMNLIDYNEIEAAKDRLEDYIEDQKEKEDSIALQFGLLMQYDLMVKTNESKERRKEQIRYALSQTVPEFEISNLKNLMLSLQELNLILEYYRYETAEQLVSCCEELMQYIKNNEINLINIAKIHPKVVFYQCRAMREMGSKDYRKMIKNCNEAVSNLQSDFKMYYLWELLDMRESIYKEWMQQMNAEGNVSRLHIVQQLEEKNKELLQVIEEIYSKCGVDRKSGPNSYFYRQQEVYCINEVLAVRRKMLGISRRKLSAGICSEKTIERMENNYTKIQMPIVKQLFERLNLSGEFQRSEVVTDDYKVMELLEKLAKTTNNRDQNDRAILEEIKKRISMEIPLNRQYIEREYCSIMRRERMLSGEEAVERLLKALRYTLPLEELKKAKLEKKYLTDGEMSCINSLAIYTGTDEINPYFEITSQLCRQFEMDGVENHIGMYELLLGALMSVLGNAGQYEKSDAIAEQVMYQSMRFQRSNELDQCVYNNIWNYEECLNGELSRQQREYVRQELKKCVILSHYNRRTAHENHYLQKMKNYES